LIASVNTAKKPAVAGFFVASEFDYLRDKVDILRLLFQVEKIPCSF